MVDTLLFLADFTFTFVAPACIFALVALALNLQWGHAGLFNAGIAGFFGLGAYVGAIVMTPSIPAGVGGPGHAGFVTLFPGSVRVTAAFFVGGLAAMAASGLVALLIAIPTLRLRADYLAISTLALAAIVVESIRNWDPVTGGVYGIQGVPRPLEFGQEVWWTEIAFAIVCGLILIVVFVLVNRATRSPWGRVLKAIREDEDAALALGKNTYFLKAQSFVIGAAITGGAGALYASLLRGTIPDTFAPRLTFSIWVMVIVGGSGNSKGVILGAFALTFLEYFTLRVKYFVTIPDVLESRIFFIRLILIGAILVVLILFRPQGLLPEPAKVSRRPRIVFGRHVE
jgi:branched-chain amino acid transport system permease protein